MKNQTIVDRIMASALVFFVIMVITLFATMPFGETLFMSEKITNLIILGIPACISLLHYFYVPNVGSVNKPSLSNAVTSVTTNKPSLSFVIAVSILTFLLIAYQFGPVLFKLFG